MTESKTATVQDVDEIKNRMDQEARELGNEICSNLNDFVIFKTEFDSIGRAGELKIKFGEGYCTLNTKFVIRDIQNSNTHVLEDVYFGSRSIKAKHEDLEKLKSLEQSRWE